MARTLAERLVDDIVNVQGEDVRERRLVIAGSYIDTWESTVRHLEHELAAARRGGLDPEPRQPRRWDEFAVPGINGPLPVDGRPLEDLRDPTGQYGYVVKLDSDAEARIKWLEREVMKLATLEQQDRCYRTGQLIMPEPELLQLAREEIFKPFSQYAKWTPLKWSDVRHAEGCRGTKSVDVTAEDVSFDDLSRRMVGVQTMDTYARIAHDAALMATSHIWFVRSKQVFELKIRHHIARCNNCPAFVQGYSVLVSTVWAGRPLSREFAL